MRGVVLLGVFVISWFSVLFCILPVGLGGEVDPPSGAPENPCILLKLAISLGIAVVLWVVFYAFVATGVIQL